MFRKVALMSWYEARMSSRGWRFWLLLALVVGISLFARRDYLLRIDSGFFLHTAFSFQHPSFWLMISILGLGASALSLDVCGRLRHSHMDKILFPLPVRSMEIMVGRLMGVMIILIPLSLAGIFSLAFWQYLYGNGTVIWQPFWVAFFLLVLPILLPTVSLFIMLRTFFKHDFVALLVGGALGTALAIWGEREGIWIDAPEIVYYLANASPTLGVQIAYEKYWIQFILHSVLSLAFLSMAPLYFRRQEPQRWVVRRDRNRIISLDALMRVITNLRFDRHLGWGYRLSLAFVLVVSTGGILWARYLRQDLSLRNEDRAEDLVVRLQFPSVQVNVVRYEIAMTPNRLHNRLNLEARLIFIPEEANKYLGVELDRRFVVEEAFLDEEPCSFTRQDNRIRFNFLEATVPGKEQTLRVRYHGSPVMFHPDYTALLSVWYPVPWRKLKTENERWVQVDNDLFEAEITLNLRPGQKGAFAGDLVETREENDRRIERWRTLYPVESMQVFWGKYGCVEKESYGYRIRFYHLPSHDYQARVYLEEIKEQQNYVHEKLGTLPFPQLTLIETPYHWIPEYIPRRSMRNPWIEAPEKSATRIDPMPGVLLVSENHLCYLNERMWLIERFDHDPRTIPFYQLLPYVLPEIHKRFYQSLISAYFDHSIHPTGELAFWIREHLSSYASKLLERNPWVRRYELNYDVGTSSNLPISVARGQALLDLRKSGEYANLEQIRGEALFRMLHHLMGDKAWWAFLRDVFQRHRFEEIPVESLYPLLTSYYGENLDWYVRDWILGKALPEYEITLAVAKILEDKSQSGIKYETSIQVKNHGTGRMAVPVYLETEMDYVTRNLWLDAGEEKTLTITVPHRPIFAMIDPEKWILQLPYLDTQKKMRGHSECRVVIEGQESTALRTNLRRNRERHFWRHR